MGERMKKLTTASSQPSGAASYFTYVNLFARPTVGDLQRLKLTDVDRIWVVSLLGETVSEWTTNVKTLSEWVADIEQRQAKSHFKLNEAAQVLADENELDAGDLLLAMAKAVRAGRLAVRNPSTGLRKEPFKDVSFTELVFVEDIDEWLGLERVSYRFPESKRRGRASALTPDEKVEVGKLLARGDSVSKVAERFGVSRRTIDKCKPSAKETPPAPGLKDVWKPPAQSKRT
jgi:hypothetical protein